ncbi:MAG: spermidine/putrescine ABC transporter ATP-binding protein [Opitutae bacterium]|nr:spermidine/putrescine ABC transporter ATP-binding protein [Opitutae bacterium]|tara:strand:+ start:406 stop:1479 length:1074 start_codon:yes stop_codon:yes gene_type:complete
MIAVTVKELVKKFGDTVALNAIDLAIEPGELFFLLGPSGCGKTTLLRSIAGFYVPDSGTIHFDEEDVTSLEPHRRNTGMMFQSYALWPHKSVHDNVAFGLEQQKLQSGEISKRVEEALELVQMKSYAERKPNALSGGQQQRVALARALVVRPRCLLLDEPLSNLDAKLRLEMRTEIRRICKEFNLTTIYVTHDQKEALSIADRMAVLDQGNILQIDSPTEMYKRPLNRFVANFIGETNFLKGKVVSTAAGNAVVDTELGEMSGKISNSEFKPNEGDTVHLSLNPECIRLKEDSSSEENSFKCHIEDSIFYGEVAHYVIRGGEKEFKVSELNPRNLNRPGDREMHACFYAKDLVVLKD